MYIPIINGHTCVTDQYLSRSVECIRDLHESSEPLDLPLSLRHAEKCSPGRTS